MRKKMIGFVLGITIALGCALPALAKTVYFNGNAVYWDYGRKWVVYSYSEVQTSLYEHSATANSVSSGWEYPGVVAYAEDFIGKNTAYCYWNCR